uniref:Replication protein A C-terminal domain-containing protein n=1 Tax=Pygocentrus nattereri TaxID=42514 RepID=A0AAR2IPT0_PYGNA
MWNQGSYGEASMGGGYTQSPGGFGSPAASQGGDKKGRTRAQQIVPCTVSQLMSAAQAEDVFRVGDVEVAQDPSVDSSVIPPNTYVKVSGNLRSFQNNRSLVAFSVRPLEDMNEITSHMLEVVQAHMLLSKPQAMAGGGGGMNSSIMPMSRPGMGSMGMTGGYSGANAMVNNGLSPNQNQVLSLIKSCPEPQGISIQELKQRLSGVSMTVIRQVVDFLSNEGHIFSTIDEDHFRSTDQEA